MRCNIPPIYSLALTSQAVSTNYFIPAIKSRQNSSGRQSKRIFNEWIHRWHHHPHHWWLKLDGTIQKWIITVDQHHNLATLDFRTTNSGHPHITPQTRRWIAPCRRKDISGLGYLDMITTGITPQRKGGGLCKWNQGVPILNSTKMYKLEYLNRNLNHATHIIPPRMVLTHKNKPYTQKGEEMGTKISPILE